MSDSHEARLSAVVYAKDVSQLSAFYAAVLDADQVDREPDYVVLGSPACQLVVLAIPSSIAANILIASPPSRRTDSPLKLVFPVDSIAKVRELATELGGEIDSPEHEWQFQGDRVCDGHDPEGNVLQLRQRLT